MDNVVSVAATTTNDALAAYSNYGATSVALAALQAIMFTQPLQLQIIFIATDSGTSIGRALCHRRIALLLEKYPGETYQQIINRLLVATDPLPSLAGKCVTGGRLNLRNALNPPIKLTVISAAGTEPFQLQVSSSPNRSCVIETSTNLADWSPVFTNITSTAGAFDFTNQPPANSPQEFFRAVSSL